MSFYFIPILSSHTNNPQKSLHPLHSPSLARLSGWRVFFAGWFSCEQFGLISFSGSVKRLWDTTFGKKWRIYLQVFSWWECFRQRYPESWKSILMSIISVFDRDETRWYVCFMVGLSVYFVIIDYNINNFY